MQPLVRRPPFFPFALFAVGLGLTFWYGDKYRTLEEPDAQYIENSVDINVAFDLARRGPASQPDAEQLQRLREQVRAEVQAEIQRERDEVHTGLGMGLLALVLAGGALVLNRMSRT